MLRRKLWHYLNEMPIRVSALRALGACANVFALESFMDVLALVDGADPVEFRLRHLEDPRAVAVIETAAERFGWSNDPLPPSHGRGFAFARYKSPGGLSGAGARARRDAGASAFGLRQAAT